MADFLSSSFDQALAMANNAASENTKHANSVAEKYSADAQNLKSQLLEDGADPTKISRDYFEKTGNYAFTYVDDKDNLQVLVADKDGYSSDANIRFTVEERDDFGENRDQHGVDFIHETVGQGIYLTDAEGDLLHNENGDLESNDSPIKYLAPLDSNVGVNYNKTLSVEDENEREAAANAESEYTMPVISSSTLDEEGNAAYNPDDGFNSRYLLDRRTQDERDNDWADYKQDNPLMDWDRPVSSIMNLKDNLSDRKEMKEDIYDDSSDHMVRKNSFYDDGVRNEDEINDNKERGIITESRHSRLDDENEDVVSKIKDTVSYVKDRFTNDDDYDTRLQVADLSGSSVAELNHANDPEPSVPDLEPNIPASSEESSGIGTKLKNAWSNFKGVSSEAENNADAYVTGSMVGNMKTQADIEEKPESSEALAVPEAPEADGTSVSVAGRTLSGPAGPEM